MSWKDTLKAYDPDKRDAKRRKIQRRNEYLKREEKRLEEERRQRDWERKNSLRGGREEEHAMSEFVAGRRNSPNAAETDKPTKRKKKQKRGRLPPKPQRGRRKEVNSENLERMAGTVTTTAPAHAKLFKPAYRTRKKRKDE